MSNQKIVNKIHRAMKTERRFIVYTRRVIMSDGAKCPNPT